MNILCVGDVCGNWGCDWLTQILPRLKAEKNIDFVIANGENSADGNGITPFSAERLFSSGIDVVTGGNHTFRRKEIFDLLETSQSLIRPGNYPDSAPGKGYAVVDCGRTSVAVINLIGTTYMESLACPFRKADELIERAKSDGARIILVDFHAEATSEKRALGFYLDGRISALFGTHTHVQTADCQILPNGTGYITDVGMTGTVQSVLGVKPEIVISKFMNRLPVRFDLAKDERSMNGCIFTVDDRSGICSAAESVNF